MTLSEKQSFEPVNTSTGRLHFEMESLLLKMGAEFADRRQYLVFVINNYDAIANNMTAVRSTRRVLRSHG